MFGSGLVTITLVVFVTSSVSGSADVKGLVGPPNGSFIIKGGTANFPGFNGSSYYGSDVANPGPFIVNGVATAISNIPHQLALYAEFIDQRGHKLMRRLCGGFLVTRTRAITAAQCITGVPMGTNKATFYIAMGVANLNRLFSDPNAQFIKVSQVVLNKKFDPKTFANDIAVLKLSAPVLLTRNVKTVRLSTTPWLETVRRLARKYRCSVSGWGLDKDGDGTNNNGLKTTEVLIMYNRVCNVELKRKYPTFKGIPSGTVCAVDRQLKTSPCLGDGGGPLTCVSRRRGLVRILGFVSFGDISCTPGVPTVFTRVSSFEAWIKANIK